LYRNQEEIVGSLVQYYACAVSLYNILEIRNQTSEEDYHLNMDNPVFEFSNIPSSLNMVLNLVKRMQDQYEKQLKFKSLFKSTSEDTKQGIACENIENQILSGKNCIFFQDIIGNDIALQNMNEGLISPFKYPCLYPDRPKGILLYGPPGTGKTFLVKAAVTELQFNISHYQILFYAPTGAELKGKYVGETEKRIKAYFECASKAALDCETINQKKSLSILFIDEIDSIARSRSNDLSGINANATNALLQMMDGVSTVDNILVMGATNFPWDLDEAILRRFDVKIYINLPDEESRIKLLKKYMVDYVNKCIKYASQIENEKKETSFFGEDTKEETNAVVNSIIMDNKADQACPLNQEKNRKALEQPCVHPTVETTHQYFDELQFMLNVTDHDLQNFSKNYMGVKGKQAAFSPSDIASLVKKVSRKSASNSLKTGLYYRVEFKEFPDLLSKRLHHKNVSLNTLQCLKKKYRGLTYRSVNIALDSSVIYGIQLSDESTLQSLVSESKESVDSIFQWMQDYRYENEKFNDEEVYFHNQYVSSFFLEEIPSSFLYKFSILLQNCPSTLVEYYINIYTITPNFVQYIMYKRFKTFQSKSHQQLRVAFLVEGVITDNDSLLRESGIFSKKKHYSDLTTWVRSSYIKSIHLYYEDGWFSLNDKYMKEIDVEKLIALLFSDEAIVVDTLNKFDIFNTFSKSVMNIHHEDIFTSISKSYVHLFRFSSSSPSLQENVREKTNILNFDFNPSFFRETFDVNNQDAIKSSSLASSVDDLDRYHKDGSVPKKKS